MLKLLPLFVIYLIFITKLHNIVGTGNVFTTAQNKTYYIDREQKYTWYGALAKCASMNMSLVTIDTELKSDDLTSLLMEMFHKKTNLWAGGCAVGKIPNEFAWISNGQKFQYTNWAKYQPDFKNNSEYCLQIGWNDRMQWNDQVCHNKSGVICEYSRLHDCQEKLQAVEHLNLPHEMKDQTQTEVQQNLEDIVQTAKNVSDVKGEHFRDVTIYVNNYYSRNV